MHRTAIELSAAEGLWQRTALILPDAPDDRTSTVWWLQGPSRFVDTRPQPNGRDDGFAGVTEHHLRADGEVEFHWRRHFELQPPDGPDEATVRFDAAQRPVDQPQTLIEDGIHATYRELWARASPRHRRPSFAVEGKFAGGRGLVVAAHGYLGLAVTLDGEDRSASATSLAIGTVSGELGGAGEFAAHTAVGAHRFGRTAGTTFPITVSADQITVADTEWTKTYSEGSIP